MALNTNVVTNLLVFHSFTLVFPKEIKPTASDGRYWRVDRCAHSLTHLEKIYRNETVVIHDSFFSDGGNTEPEVQGFESCYTGTQPHRIFE